MAQDIVFGEDFTAQPNSYVLAYINTRLSGATVTTLATGQMYRPRFTDEEFEPTNTSSAGIPRGALLAFDGGPFRVRLMTNADPVALFAGVAMFDIEAGKTGRVKTAGYMMLADVLRDDSPAPAYGDTLSIGTPGRAKIGGAAPVLRAIRPTAVAVLG